MKHDTQGAELTPWDEADRCGLCLAAGVVILLGGGPFARWWGSERRMQGRG